MKYKTLAKQFIKEGGYKDTQFKEGARKFASFLDKQEKGEKKLPKPYHEKDCNLDYPHIAPLNCGINMLSKNSPSLPEEIKEIDFLNARVVAETSNQLIRYLQSKEKHG